MKRFKDFGIEATTQGFVGNKIKIYKIFGQEITVHHFEIRPSKFEGKPDYLALQITKEETKYLVITSSVTLKEMIRKVPKENFPFKTIIEKKDERYQFT